MEFLLSSTASTSSLPSTTLHSLATGANIFQFKSPNNSTNPNQAVEKDVKEKDSIIRQTMGYVQGSDGVGGAIIGLGGKEGRAGLNVWGFQKEQVLQRLVPPIRLTTLTVSCTGQYLAGGTLDGRIFLWEISSGNLISTIDAHYRTINVLSFSSDDSCLVSGSADAGISVWSIGNLLNATPLEPATPFATLTDHTLPITSIQVGLGTFPKCRILSSSLDGTVKLWDLRTAPAALLSTFSFPSPITQLVFDPLERFFFVACPVPLSTVVTDEPGKKVGGSKVMRVNLFKKMRDDVGYEFTQAVGGGGRGEVDSITQAEEYWVADSISALHLSVHSPTLIVGTSTSSIHTLSLPSLIPTRIIPPMLSTIPPGPITFLSTLLRPVDLGEGTNEGGLPARVIMKDGIGRIIKGTEGGGKNGRSVSVRIGESSDVRNQIYLPTISLLPTSTVASPSGGEKDLGASKKLKEMEAEILGLKTQLNKAVNMNETLWKRVVDGSLKLDQK